MVKRSGAILQRLLWGQCLKVWEVCTGESSMTLLGNQPRIQGKSWWISEALLWRDDLKWSRWIFHMARSCPWAEILCEASWHVRPNLCTIVKATDLKWKYSTDHVYRSGIMATVISYLTFTSNVQCCLILKDNPWMFPVNIGEFYLRTDWTEPAIIAYWLRSRLKTFYQKWYSSDHWILGRFPHTPC